jgi:hypothetical protein
MDEALRVLSETITLHVTDNNFNFPFVTVPNFEVLGQQVQSRSGAEAIFFLPLVTAETLDEWNDYATYNQGWLEESRNFLLVDPEDFVFEPSPISPTIYSSTASMNGTDPFFQISNGEMAFPIWQTSPPPVGSFPINLDAYTSIDSFPDLVVAASVVQTGVVGEAVDPAAWLSNLVGFRPSDTPRLQVVYPVYDALPVVSSGTSQVTAVIVALLDLDRYLEAISPSDVEGILAVVFNRCGQSHSFQLNHPQQVVYLGAGDLHDVAYDAMVVKIPFQFFNVPATEWERLGQCGDYSLFVYPTETFERQFQPTMTPSVTPKPTILSVTDPSEAPISQGTNSSGQMIPTSGAARFGIVAILALLIIG